MKCHTTIRATLVLLGVLGAAGSSGCIKDVGVTQCPDGNWCSPGYDCQDRDNNGVYECVLDTCGNGQVEAGEDCDPGAVGVDTATCDFNCTTVVCGDGYVNATAGEECDPGAVGTDTTDCDSDCTLPSCGDGHVNSVTGEVCDDGNNTDCDGCRGDCSAVETGCGDGLLCGNEACDDGNQFGGDDCPDHVPTSVGGCQPARCGDGFVQSTGSRTETCDDGNNIDGDDCPSDPAGGNCQAPATCGDGIIQTSGSNIEDCDCGLDVDDIPTGCATINGDFDGANCSARCDIPICGDGVVNTGGGEECDTGALRSDTIPDRCRMNCLSPFCGDGVTDSVSTVGYPEACDCGFDPANLPTGCTGINSDTNPAPCRATCTRSQCGDGIVDPGEQCDDQNSINTDDCKNDCTANVCGDAVLNTNGEICDCGNGSQPLPAACGGPNSDTDPNPCRLNCTNAQCGNGIREGTEQCDNGASNSDTVPDACRTNCTLARCGDGVADTSEVCDCGTNPTPPLPAGCTSINSNTTPNACRTTCVLPSCGDSVLDTNYSEQCDNGPLNSNTVADACRTNCTNPVCGDAVADIGHGEQCDDGANNSNSLPNACRTNCMLAHCGDGVRDAGEACDDGNQIDTDACRNNCMLAGCGDGVLGPGEECDSSGVDTPTCNAICTVPVCGDGYYNPAAGEACDTAGNSATCDADCTLRVCGDNYVNTAVEDCDPGSAGVNTATCDSDCTFPVCGDGHLNLSAGESCDPGNVGVNTATCDSDCTAPVCGDDHVNSAAGEACDPGAIGVYTPTCNANCTLSVCGDGIVNAAAGELCDPGTVGLDTTLCDSDCTLPQCGDGHTNTATGEQCDDSGNSATCDSDCTTRICGDGFVNGTAGEICDPGTPGLNTATCDSDCTAPVCGDNLLNTAAGETCDPGSVGANTATCDSDCTPPVCGDNHLNTTAGEICDPGAVGANTATCDSDCTMPLCGDNHLNTNAGEICDPGAVGVNTPTCDSNCTLPVCGDAFLNTAAGEVCDPGAVGVNTAGCDSDCTLPVCGDGHLNPMASELCDPGTVGADIATCDSDCTFPTCGDNHRNIPAGETCDDGEINPCTGTCNANCTGPANICGDGTIACGEACDDSGESVSCNSDCTVAVCGDGKVNNTRGETCDDGEIDPCTGTCNANCTGPANICGDGVVACGETCDSTGIDTATCNGGTCTTPICGDNYLNNAFGETCDDGEIDPCTGTCNANCDGPANTCGDGSIACSEQCDGANLNGQTCLSLLGPGASGTLTCTSPGCQFDTSACVIPCNVHSDCPLGKQCFASNCEEVGDTCAAANVPTVIPGLGTHNYSGTTENLHSTYSFPSCGGNTQSALGPDRVYQVTLAAGDYVIARVTPSGGWDASIHIFTGCPTATCRQSWNRGDEDNATDRIDYVASTAETVYIVVDGHEAADWGNFSLQVIVGAGAQVPSAAGDIIYSEVMPEPNGNITFAEWFEIYNTVGIPMNLENVFFDSCSADFTVTQPLVILPGERLVFAYYYLPSQNYGLPEVAWAYNGDHLYYNSSCTLSMSRSGTTFDSITYSGDSDNWPYNSFDVGQVGTSMYLCNTKHTATLNNEPRNWWVDTWNAYGTAANYGTPGAVNATLCDTWYNASWGRRKRIVISNILVAEDLTDFPVLVRLASDQGLDDYAQGDGDDILFALPDGTKLSHEIQRFDSSTGELIAWVKLPFISATFDTVFFMYYGNGGASNQQNPTDVWSNGYAAVLHLQESGNGTTNEYKDSTSYGHHGTGGGLSGSGDSGKTPNRVTGGAFGAYCQEFTQNNDDHIRLLPVADQDWTAVTVQAWVVATDNGDDRFFAKMWNNGADESVWSLGKDADQKTKIRSDNDNSDLNGGTSWTDNVWTHFSLTWTATTGAVVAYLNGGSVLTDTITGTTLYDDSTAPIVGNSPNLDRDLPGRIQEIRLSYVARSAGWLLTEYRSQSLAAGFLTISPEQTPW